ncbi:MAG TPA: thioredoxin domain-containing protein, partial [Polyangiaceae bacterium]|nr:thioredoxin domain-containing protein [Polyangiaceae bacterium]
KGAAPAGAAAPAASPAPADLAATRVDPSRVPVPGPDSPSRGPSNAPVTIQVWSDFECPFCAAAAPVLRELEAEFGGSVRVVFRNLPLPMHPHAALAAVTGLEVYAERGGAAFWRFHDAAFAAQRRGLDENVLEALARDEGVDPKRYHDALASHTLEASVNADIAAADAAGINGTPAFFVNSYFTVGVLPYPDMRAIVVQALKEAGH